MSRSTLLPWLLIGPIFVATSSKIVFDLTGVAFLEYLSKAGIAFALVVIAVSFAGSYRRAREIERLPPPGPPA